MVAGPRPELVTVSVYTELVPTFSPGLGADLVMDRTGGTMVLVNVQAITSPKAMVGNTYDVVATAMGNAVVAVPSAGLLP